MNKKSKNTKKWKILVTPKEAGESLSSVPTELLRRVEVVSTYGCLQDLQKLISLLGDKDAVVLALEQISYDILERCPKLKVISRFGEGCDAIDLESAKRFGIRVTRTRGVSSLAVARHTMSLILALAHNITENDRNLKNGTWIRKPNLSEEGVTLGIFGFGRIGQALADLASGFGFKILVYSRHKRECRYPYADSLDELITTSRIVSLHLPLTPETKNIISKDMIKKLKDKYLVNTARGGLVKEKALLESLKKNKILGYATDVFNREPISGISKNLAGSPKVIASPHIAALDKVTAVKMTVQAIKNALYCLNNEHGKVVSYVV